MAAIRHRRPCSGFALRAPIIIKFQWCQPLESISISALQQHAMCQLFLILIIVLVSVTNPKIQKSQMFRINGFQMEVDLRGTEACFKSPKEILFLAHYLLVHLRFYIWKIRCFTNQISQLVLSLRFSSISRKLSLQDIIRSLGSTLSSVHYEKNVTTPKT